MNYDAADNKRIIRIYQEFFVKLPFTLSTFYRAHKIARHGKVIDKHRTLFKNVCQNCYNRPGVSLCYIILESSETVSKVSVTVDIVMEC